MAKLTDRTALVTPADGDFYVTTDVSDTSDAATGTDKKITWANIKAGMKTYTDTLYAAVLGTDDNYVTDAEKVIIGNTSGTNTGDNATNSQYSGLVSNATHTGDATGDTALTVVKINGTSLAGLATGVLKNTTTTGVPFISKVALTEPATASTLTIADGQTLTVNGSATITNGTHSGTNTGDNTVATALTGTPSITVNTVTTTGNIELGNASDTTIARVSAGVISVEGKTVLTTDGGTLTGNITLGENTSLALDPAGSADGKYSGITVTGVAGYSQAFGDLVTLDKDDSRWEAVDISVAAAATGDARGVLGMVVSAGTDGNACTILLEGIIRADANFPALTIGANVYASTSGDIVVTQPTTTDHVIRIVGAALTADEIFFRPDFSWTTHT